MTLLDILVACTGVLVVIVAVITLMVYSSSKATQNKIAEFVPLGSNMQTLGLVGSGVFEQIVDARNTVPVIEEPEEEEEEAPKEYDEKDDDISIPNVLRQCLQLISLFPLLSVYGYQAYRHYHDGKSLFIHQPDNNLSTAENILRLLRPDGQYTELEANHLMAGPLVDSQTGDLGDQSTNGYAVLYKSDFLKAGFSEDQMTSLVMAAFGLVGIIVGLISTAFKKDKK